ncbi:MAG: C-GCAxxG-C-C family (seleno)protein [Peptococcaceae bacterium]
MSTENREISRRSFLTTGAAAAGTLAVSGGILSAVNLKTPKAEAAQLPQYPWPYVNLDTEKARELGYAGYMSNQCCYGAFDAVIAQLREKIGYPYNGIPSDIMIWGGTGGAGWATLCGALIGASTAINVIIGEKNNANSLVNELFGWYTSFPFPEYMPPAGKAGKVEGQLPTSIAGSVLCHASVSTWCAASKYRAEGKERSERCGRLTGDVAAKTVQMLNDYHGNHFTAVYKDPETVEDCMTCHGKGGTLENTRGKMDCIQCHDDVDPANLINHIKQQWNL